MLHTFAQQLRQHRKKWRLTQTDLAQQVGCAVSTIRHIEHGRRRPSRSLAERLAQCLELPLEEQKAFIQMAREQGPSKSTIVTPLPPTNLPTPLTSLIGRTTEIAKVVTLLHRQDVRLLTLTGIGGVGKTHLALHAAHKLRIEFTDGVFMVSLVDLRDIDMVLPTIANTLEIPPMGSTDIREQLDTYLRAKKMLLVLDNFEHLMAAASMITELLGLAPHMHILVTSRTPLKITQEHAMVVEPLETPIVSPLTTHETLRHEPAVVLFAERARTVQSTFELTPSNSTTVAAICIRVAGIPLALELAAARLSFLSMVDILHHLDHQLDMLDDGPIDVPLHQRSMRATLEWSYHLLKPAAQRLFEQLAVFVGGGTFDAIEQICSEKDIVVQMGSEDNKIKPEETVSIDSLKALLDSNLLIQTTNAHGESRVKMLAPTQAYAYERLQMNAELATLRERHATYYLVLVEKARFELVGDNHKTWLDQLEHEHNNIRAALTWTINQPQIPMAIRFGAALWRFWYMHGYIQEGCQWLAQIVSLNDTSLTATRISMLSGYAIFLGMQGNLTEAQRYFELSLTLCRQLNDQALLARTLNNIAILAHNRGAYTDAMDHFEESLILNQTLQNHFAMANAHNNLGIALRAQGRFDEAYAHFQKSMVIYQEYGIKLGIGKSLANLGFLAWLQHNHTKAKQLLSEALQYVRDLNNTSEIIHCLIDLSKIAVSERDVAIAHHYLLDCLPLIWNVVEQTIIVDFLEQAAGVIGMSGHPIIAARIWNKTTITRTDMHMPKPPSEVPFYEHLVKEVRSHVESSAWDTAWQLGRTITISSALEMVQEYFMRLREHHNPIDFPGADKTVGLNKDEHLVIRLVGQGYTNQAIAEQLAVSTRTVSTYLKRIYQKVGVSSRDALASWIAHHHMM